MISMWKIHLAAAVILVCATHGAFAANNGGGRSSGARPISAEDITGIYGGKTWVWQNGSGYFAKTGEFVAWSGSGEKATYAKGKWTVTDAGRMCMTAAWRTKAGSAENTTCFAHQASAGGNTIYQMKEPSGDWYIFKHAKIRKKDEYAKLRKGDLASTRAAAISQSIGQVSQ